MPHVTLEQHREHELDGAIYGYCEHCKYISSPPSLGDEVRILNGAAAGLVGIFVNYTHGAVKVGTCADGAPAYVLNVLMSEMQRVAGGRHDREALYEFHERFGEAAWLGGAP